MQKNKVTNLQFKGKLFSIGCSIFGVAIDGAPGTGTAFTDHNNVTHNNAIVILNTCYLLDKHLADGDNISFNISTDNKAPGSACVLPLCIVATPQPDKRFYIYDVVKN